MDVSQTQMAPQFIIFEGVDGTGKTTLSSSLAKYMRRFLPDLPLYADSFPGSLPNTLGNWVYRYHHGKVSDVPTPDAIAPAALQLLHVAAHVDAVLARIGPMLSNNGMVILDRYWWSAYAYSRINLTPEQAWTLVNAERVFWKALPLPTAIYLDRQNTLKSGEINPVRHAQLRSYYREVIKVEQKAGVLVHELSNEGALQETWAELLEVLQLPYYQM